MAAELTALVFALRREVRDLRGRMGRLERLAGAPCAAWRSARGVVLVVSGMGPGAAGRAVGWLLSGGAGGRPGRVLCGGFGGGLGPGWPVGTAVWPGRVVTEGGESWTLAAPAGAAGATLVSVADVVGDAEGRRRLAGRTGAQVVDMETAAAARLCAAAGVPLAGLRVVSDAVDQPLSPWLAEALAGGVVRPWRLGRAVARRPWLVGELWRLARDSRAAARRLAEEAVRWLGTQATSESG